MATGYRIRTWADSGNDKILNTAGSVITVLDDLLTNGSAAWSRTVNGTNDITYEAPAGSQIKVRVRNNVASTTSLTPAQLNGQVGSGTVFPTATQEASSSQYFCSARVRASTNAAATHHQRWVGIRTDRFFMVCSTWSDSTSLGAIFGGGDLPTYDPSDPGLCAIFGNCRTSSLTSTATGVDNSLPSMLGAINNASTGVVGYANVGADGVTTSVPMFPFQLLPHNGLNTVTSSFGRLLLGRVVLFTPADTTTQGVIGTASVLRGFMPFIRTIGQSSGHVVGDTFTDADGATYLVVQNVDANRRFALMTSDSEPELP
jgi:hypothetical protein